MRSPNVILRAGHGDARVRESNHRIANNLMTVATLLRYQCRQLTRVGRSLDAEDIRQILTEAGQRIELVSRLHRRLAEPIAPDVLNLSPYLNDVAETTIDSLSPPDEVELKAISSDMCPVRADHALLIGLVVGELVAGAVKVLRRAGGKARLQLACGIADDRMEITLASEGAGAAERFDPDREDRFGLGVVKLLVAQLKATLILSDPPGPMARLVVPSGFDLAEVDVAGEA